MAKRPSPPTFPQVDPRDPLPKLAAKLSPALLRQRNLSLAAIRAREAREEVLWAAARLGELAERQEALGVINAAEAGQWMAAVVLSIAEPLIKRRVAYEVKLRARTPAQIAKEVRARAYAFAWMGKDSDKYPSQDAPSTPAERRATLESVVAMHERSLSHAKAQLSELLALPPGKELPDK